ncbi:MAG: response regulator [Gloeomargaritaceae cyanobacterium C42_A2020_066]|nr:response regulator [Gloeomargaritaceae cyanobacterium C42_A2020_066]
MTKKVLIVDDEPHIRLLLEQTLEDLVDEGLIDLLMATNGQEALEMIQAERPALVFLDVMMPKMNGFDVCQKVKRDLGLVEVFIILLTAKGQEFDKAQGLKAGADIYMTKPFDPDQVVERSIQVLGLTV